MFQRVTTILFCTVLASSCASKQMHTSLTKLESDNQTLRTEVAKLQGQMSNLSNEMLVMQSRLNSQPAVPTQTSEITKPMIIPNREQKVAEVKAKEYKPATFLSDQKGETFFQEDLKFSDDEPSLKFTNRDLSNLPAQAAAGKGAAQGSKITNQSAPEPAAPAATITAAKDPKAPSSVEDPTIVNAYNRGYKAFQEQKYQESIQMMSDFLKQYPKHAYSDNAIFWRGESYFQMKDYQKAGVEFDRVVREFPNGNKVPDALLRAGICSLRLSKPEQAKTSFALLMKKYPESVAAKRAKATVGEL